MFYKFCYGNLKKVNNLNKILILIKIFSFRLETLKKIIFTRSKTFCNVSLSVKLSSILCPSIIAQMAMSDLQRYPSQLCLIKYELSFNVFNFSFFFHLRFIWKETCAFLVYKKRWRRKKKQCFSSQKNCQYHQHFGSYKGFKGTIANRTFPSFHELNIIHTVVDFKSQYDKIKGDLHGYF